MKVALITDDHFGVRNDSGLFADSLDTFYREVFWPYIDEHKIYDIVHLGDVFDRRKYVTFQTANRLRKTLVEPLISRAAIYLTVVLGNHDVPLRNTLKINGPRELLPTSTSWWPNIPRIRIIDRPYDDNTFIYLPWVCDENQAATERILQKNPRIVLGHLELVGFEMDRGRIAERGLSLDFSRSPLVCSGHYHHKSSKGNVHYLGATREQTWADLGDPKGFHVLDTKTLDLQFILNPNTIFRQIFFGEKIFNTSNKIVRVVVPEGAECSPGALDNFLAEVNKTNPADVRVLDNRMKPKPGKNIEVLNTDMLTMLVEAANEETEYVDSLKSILTELYQEARELENVE